MITAIDIETECSLGCTTKCDHALFSHTSIITCIGVYAEVPRWEEPYQQVFRSLEEFKKIIVNDSRHVFVGQNCKFDLKHLAHHGIHIPVERWVDDTQIMASVSIEKVSPAYLDWYSRERTRQNEKLPRGYSHREGKQHSLKVLAPFFLGVDPFWENPADHDNDEYVLKDCEYTYRLYQFFTERLKAQGTYEFYKEKMMPWARMLLEAEIEGMPIDLAAVKEGQISADITAAQMKAKLDQLWAEAYSEYFDEQKQAICSEYNAKSRAALDKLKNPTEERLLKVHDRYVALRDKAIAKVPTKMNLDSPTQLSWILKDYLGLDISDFDGDESTGKAVLKKLAATGREDISTFLEYRKYRKLATAFFPSYLELAHEGKIHCTFNPDGTRTGRLSSSGPNLQQVPGELHKLFIAPPGMLIADYDMSAIEAKLIAFYSQDPALFYLCNSGDDFHGFNVATVYFPELNVKPNEVKALFPHERAFAKTLGYALFYGAGWTRIQKTAMQYGFEWSRNECIEKLENFRETYRGVWEYKKEIDALAISEPIESIFGRKASYPNHEDIYMKAFNTLIQGTASDLVLESAYRIRNRMKEAGIDGGPRLFVHDEIVTVFDETKEKEVVEIIARAMTDYKLNTSMGPIKLEVEGKVGKVWAK